MNNVGKTQSVSIPYKNMLNTEGDIRSAVVYAPLRDGVLRIRVDAFPYQAGGNHKMQLVECEAAAKPHQTIIRQVIAAARLSERTQGHGIQIWIDFDREVPADDDLWHLAVVLADRLSRGVIPAGKAALFALGTSHDWASGYIHLPEGAAARIRAIPQNDGVQAVIAKPQDSGLVNAELSHIDKEQWAVIGYLGALLGHPDPQQSYRSAKVLFPLVGGQSELAWVEVSVQPVQTHKESEVGNGDSDSIDNVDNIVVTKQDPRRQQQIKSILNAARALEKDQGKGWLSRVTFSREAFSDNSYELALVMADRMARGRELKPPKRLIATGCSSQWHLGTVEPVGAIEEKIALCEQLLDKGDRLLLPKKHTQVQLLKTLKEKGVSIGLLTSVAKL